MAKPSIKFSPPKIILFFFLTVILLGTAILSLPISIKNGCSFSFLTNLFTATSAVCVTGLTVTDIGQYYSLFGQCIILVLIQAGGLGYMTLSTILGLFLGKISLKERSVIREVFDVSSFAGLLELLKKIVVIVFFIETLGAVILTFIFSRQFPFLKALYLGIFHSISAFCNAGLSLFRNNLLDYSNNSLMLLVISCLVIIGGIGFLVLVEIGSLLKSKYFKLSLHSKVVLLMTLFLITVGFLSFWFLESNNVLTNKNILFSATNSFFHSVTARTAGFNALSIHTLCPATAILLMCLMFIGASPGGTGGGIKTTTFMVLITFVLSTLKGENDINLYKRRIFYGIINKSLTIFILSIFVIIFAVFVLANIEKFPLLDIIFETTSAFGTVGFSRGITPYLSNIGKLIIIITMITGRIGILAFLMAFIKKLETPSLVKYPEGKVLIG